MQLLLTDPIIERLQLELRRAGRQEIGGLLMGEHIRDDIFRVVDISVQHTGGSQGCFVRDPGEHQAQLDAFFTKTNADYVRFNYLGEWHSHPSFQPVASVTDIQTMQSIVHDPAVGANFLVLLIPRLHKWRTIELSAIGFRKGGEPFSVVVCREREPAAEGSFLGCIRRIFRL
jgi:[CysO sulfur-carrier protein]-S-L-cysteine hydrolase